MQRRVADFYQDEQMHWVARLECGHSRHVRHDPPWTIRDWVLTEAGRAERIGTWMECNRCEPERTGD